MSSIVLSSSVRQNLLSLQSTADLLSTTQNRLATGKKVNTALDNPTNYFTAASLDNRASDISNLLDGIGNGVQVLQAANTGITSLQKLADSAKSVATQALQATIGYSAKSSVSVNIHGATSDDLRGAGAPVDAALNGANVVNNQAVIYSTGTGAGSAITATSQSAYLDATVQGSAATATQSSVASATFTGSAANATVTTYSNTSITGYQQLYDNYYYTQVNSSTPISRLAFHPNTSEQLIINGKTVSFPTSGPVTFDGSGNVSIGIDQTLGQLLAAIDVITGNTTNPSTIVNGRLNLSTGVANDLTLQDNFIGLVADDFGFSRGNFYRGSSTASTALTGSTQLAGAVGGSGALSTAFSAGDTLTVDGHLLTFQTSGVSDANHINVTDNVTTLLSKIDGLSGGAGSTVSGGQIVLDSGTTSDLSITSSNGAALAALGLGSGVTQARNTSSGSVALAGSTFLSGAALGTGALSAGFAAGNYLSVNGQTLTFQASGASGANQINVTDDVTTLLGKIDALSGGSGSLVSGGRVTLHTGTTSDLSITSNNNAALTALGLGTGVTQNRAGGITNNSAITTAATRLTSVGPGNSFGLNAGLTTSDYLIVNNKTITFNSGNTSTGSIAGNDLSIGLGTGTVSDILSAIATATGGTAAIDGAGKINLTTSLTGDISLAGSLAGTLSKLGLSGAATTTVTRTAVATPAITSSTLLSGASTGSSDSLTTAFAAGDTVTVNGQNLTFVASGASDNTHINIGDTVGNLLTKIDVLSGNTGTGAVPSSVSGGHVALHTGAASDLSISSSNAAAFAALGFSAPVSQARGTGPSPLNGLTLSIGATGGGTASNLTFGSGAGQVKSLNDLNNKLASNNLRATLASDGTLTVTTSNDAASATIGAITGTAAASGAPFNGLVASAPVADASAASTRNNLVDQFNNILNQITTTVQDASFNGVDLLSGDTLKLTFNETGKSTLRIQGVNFNAAGLGLATLNTSDFKDNVSVNKVVSSLEAVNAALRSQASSFGSNLSIVQIRQDFSKNLINVLQTGSSNLTLADTNEEAANSQALSTRQSIAVSALALANTSQQSVLQLLR